MKKQIELEDLTVVVDTKEKPQVAWNFSPMQSVRHHMETGDYTIAGLESEFTLERKAIGDLLNCIGNDRARWEKCVTRLLEIPTKAVIIECTWDYFVQHKWRFNSAVNFNAALASVWAWQKRGLPFIWAGSPQQCVETAKKLMLIAARRRSINGHREVCGFSASLVLPNPMMPLQKVDL